VLSEAVIEHLLRRIADVTPQPDLPFAQKKFLRVLAHSVKGAPHATHATNATRGTYIGGGAQ
jgi:hypothetical protein